MKSAEKSGKKSGKKSLNIVLDSQEFIIGIANEKSPSAKLLSNLDRYNLYIFSMIEREVIKGLRKIHSKLPYEFFRIIKKQGAAIIDYKLPPTSIIDKYQASGLKRPDATIAAYTEWKNA